MIRPGCDITLISTLFSLGREDLLDNRQKELAFNDFYRTKEWKLGSVQSFGRLPPPEILAESIEQELHQGTPSGRSFIVIV